MNLLDLPNIVLIQVFEHLSFEEISKKRLVCGKIDRICQHILNRGFNKVVRQHAVIFKRIKALLPRRESERRNHCMARHADILSSIETRISMLSMTYTKYIDLDLCCFIPGRVLDEILRILRLISNTVKPLRTHEVLQELRDISSMAIEHFDENIASSLKRSYHMYSGNTRFCSSTEANKNKVSTFFSEYLDNKTNMLLLKNCGSQGVAESLPNSTVSEFIADRTSLQSTTQGGLSSVTDTERAEPLSIARKLHLRSKSLCPSTSPFKTIETVGNCRLVRMLENGKGDISTGVKLLEPTNANNSHEIMNPYQCPEAKAAMTYFKKLELEYKRGIVKMQRMQQIQMQQSRRLQQALSSVAELNVQVIELRKRLEDVDAKNREISANIKQINTGEPVTAATVASTAPSNTPPAAEALATPISVPLEKNSATSVCKSAHTPKKIGNQTLSMVKSTKRNYDVKKTDSAKDVSLTDDLPSTAKKIKY